MVNLTKAPPIHCKGMPATLFEAIRFLHSILLIIEKAAYGLLRFPCAQRGALWYGGLCKKRTKCGTHRLDHLCAPLFVVPRERQNVGRAVS